MDFFGIDLTRVPQYSLAAENLPLLIFPILAVVTMFISTHISMKASGQEMQGSMKPVSYTHLVRRTLAPMRCASAVRSLSRLSR